jgi:rod shape determining protein RodA
MSSLFSIDWSRLRRMRLTMLLAMLGLIIIGVAFVHSASCLRESALLRDQYLRHAGMAAAGLLCYVVLAYVDYHALLRWSWVFYALGIMLLVLVLLMGTSQMGARRWVFGIQPSEIAKLATILVVAQFLGRRGSSRGVWVYLAALGLMLLPMSLIVRQPDLGSALVFAPIVLAMIFAANVAPRTYWAVLAAAVLTVGLVLAAVVAAEDERLAPATRERLRHATHLTDYQCKRITMFLYPERDPYGDGWNRRQSEIAVGSGGAWGKGYLKGDQNVLGYLPAKVSSNDFIFSVLAEETGFAGSMTVLLLFAGVILPAFAVAVGCRDGVGRLVCVGVATLIFCHMFVNMGMTVGLLPVTGVPLPFISYGRTFMLTIMVGLGLVQSVAVHAHRTALRF